MRRLAILAASAFATLAAVAAAWELRSALVLVLLAIATSAAVQPLVDLLARRVPLRAALGLTWALALVVPAVALSFAVGQLVLDLQAVADGLLPLYEGYRQHWAHGNAVERAVAEHLPSLAVGLGSTTPGEALRRTVGVGVDAVTLLGELMVVATLSMFWTGNRDVFERLWLSLVPVDLRPRAQDTWAAIKRSVGEKVRADAVEGVVAGAVLYLGFLALGLEHGLLPALAAGVFRLVPLVGWLLSLLVTLVAALATDPAHAPIAVAYAAVTMAALEALAPRLLRIRAYSGLLLTLVVIVLADAYGVLGLLFAPAVAVSIQVLFEKRLSSDDDEGLVPRPSTAELDGRLDALRALMARPGLVAAPELLSVVQRLTVLVAATEEETGRRAG